MDNVQRTGKFEVAVDEEVGTEQAVGINRTFFVEEGATLNLEKLYAKVVIQTAVVGQIQLMIRGDDELLNDLSIFQTGKNVTIRGTGNYSSPNSSISVGNISGSSIVMINGVVIVDGRVISGGNSHSFEPLQMVVLVPEGTNLDVDDVFDVKATGLGGQLYCILSNLNKLFAKNVSRVKVKCSGQSSCEITKASGNVDITCSGQSQVSCEGNFQDVDLTTSGQSSIALYGPCANIIAASSGQSSINQFGKISGKVKRNNSGQSRIRIG